MKKIITLLIAVLISCSAFTCMVAAEDYIIETELSINGTGSFDITRNVQTELGFTGKSLDQDFYTRWMGTDGDSNLKFDSALEIYMGNSSEFEDERITTIDYAQTAFSTNAKALLCSKNYDMGASQGVESKGNTMSSMEVAMDDTVNEFDFEGDVNGRLRFMQKAVDPVSRVIYLDEDIRLDGRYTGMWNGYIEMVSYPEGCEDYLGCP